MSGAFDDYEEAAPDSRICECKDGHWRCHDLDCACPEHPRLDFSGLI